MSYISTHTISVNLPAVQHNGVRIKPVTRYQQVTKPQTNIDQTKIVRVAHSVNAVRTIQSSQTITQIVPRPQTINSQSTESVSEDAETNSTSYVGSSVDIYA